VILEHYDMSTEVRWRRGTTAQHATFTGAIGEVTIDTDKNVAVVHDGVTAGGNPLLSEFMAVNKVDTISVLSTKVAPTNAYTVNVLNYYNGLKGGGGVFYWDATRSSTEHNGGTIISPLATFPTDWNDQTQVTNWFTCNKIGSGCWVRQHQNELDTAWFGLTSSTPAIAVKIGFEKMLSVCAQDNGIWYDPKYSIFVSQNLNTTGVTIILPPISAGRNGLTITGKGFGGFNKTDSTFMFDAQNDNSGNLTFDSLTFKGINNAPVANRPKIFNGNRIINTLTQNCIFMFVGKIWEALPLSQELTTSGYLQSITSINDWIIQNSDIAIHAGAMYDCAWTRLSMEEASSADCAFMKIEGGPYYNSTNMTVIRDSLIEGLNYQGLPFNNSVIYIGSNGGMLSIENLYTEGNTSNDITIAHPTQIIKISGLNYGDGDFVATPRIRVLGTLGNISITDCRGNTAPVVDLTETTQPGDMVYECNIKNNYSMKKYINIVSISNDTVNGVLTFNLDPTSVDFIRNFRVGEYIYVDSLNNFTSINNKSVIIDSVGDTFFTAKVITTDVYSSGGRVSKLFPWVVSYQTPPVTAGLMTGYFPFEDKNTSSAIVYKDVSFNMLQYRTGFTYISHFYYNLSPGAVQKITCVIPFETYLSDQYAAYITNTNTREIISIENLGITNRTVEVALRNTSTTTAAGGTLIITLTKESALTITG
jgi:hypothetical protein